MPESPTKPFSGIFVSYRRDDSSGHAGRLYDKLVSHFGKDRIFMDIDTIEPGEDFVTIIENAVGSCEILIAVIGRNWLSGTGGSMGRLNDPTDFVRVEIAAALRRDIRVIPVLVQRASMPKQQDLPDDLAKFARRNAIELTDLRWPSDVDELIRVMERVLAKREEAARPPEEEQRKRDEEALLTEGAERQRIRADEKAQRRRLETEKQSQLDLTAIAATASPSPAQLLDINSTPDIANSIQSLSEARRKRTALFAIIAAVAVLAIVVGIWMWTKSSPADPKTAKTMPADKPTLEPKLEPTASGNASRGNELFGQDKFVEAEPYYREAVRLDPTNGVYASYLGVILFRQQKYAEAELYERQAMALQPNNAVVHHNLAEAMFRQQKFAEAEPQYRDAVRLDPDNAVYKNNLGVVLQQLGKYAEAEVYFRQSVRLQPTDALFRDNLGNALAAQHKNAEAEVQHREAVRLEPGNTLYQQHLNAIKQKE